MPLAAISLSDWIAAVALVVAALSAGGTIGAWREARKALNYEKQRDQELKTAVIKFEFEHKVDRPSSGAFGGPNKNPYVYFLRVIVVNDGETTENLESLKIQTAGSQPVRDYDVSATGGKLGPHHRYAAWVDTTELPESADGLIAVAKLARGEAFVSGRIPLDQGSAAQAKEKNAAAGLT